MTGIVVIRAPNEMRVIHRAVLSFCLVNPRDTTLLQWMHLGDHLLQGFDVDVLPDDDATDYVATAAAFFETIASPRFCAQNVYWTWNASTKTWTHDVAPLELPKIGPDLEVEMEHVGYGSLGR